VLKIIRHCSTSTLNPPPAGQLLGLATTGVLDVSDSFPLPVNHIFPPHISEDQSRDKDSRDNNTPRRREESFDTAYANAASYTAQVLPRMAELNSDALNGVVGFYTGVRDGVIVGQGGGLVDALVRYQLGSEALQHQNVAAGGKPRTAARLASAGDRRPAGKGVALVYGSCPPPPPTLLSPGRLHPFSNLEKHRRLERKAGHCLSACLPTDRYLHRPPPFRENRCAKVPFLSFRPRDSHVTDPYLPLLHSLADAGLVPGNILREYPVTISRSSLLAALLSTLSTSNVPSYTPLDVPGLGRVGGGAASTTAGGGVGGLTQPLTTLAANFDQAVNVIGNLRYRDRRGKAGQQAAGGQESHVDALKGLAAADGAAKGLSEAAGVGIVRAFGAKAGAE
jgi:translation initiation factor 3 subunit H